MTTITKVLLATKVVSAVLAVTATCAGEVARPDKLLAVGLKNTPTAVQSAHEEYTRLKSKSANDARIDFAYALVLTNQARYKQAIPLIEKYLKGSPNDLDAQRILLHLQVLDRKYAPALASCLALAGRVENPHGDDRVDQLAEVAEFIGIVFGYLELRGAAAINPVQLSNAKNRVLARLDPKLLEAFDQGRRDTLALYHRAESDQEVQHSTSQVAEEERRRETQTSLDSSRGSALDQRTVAQQSGEQLREAQREYDVLAQQLVPMLNDRTLISVQSIVVQNQIMSLVQSFNEQIAGRRANNYSYSPYYSPDAPVVASLSATLANLNRQALQLDRRILALQTRASELVTAGAKASEELAESTAALAKSEKRAKNLEKQLARAERKAATKAAAAKGPAITGRMVQFSTYAPFPYEQEKERVLSWYAK